MSGLTYMGIELVENKMIPAFVPKMVLDNSVMVTDEFRLNFNQWLREFFGQERAFYVMDGKMITHPDNIKFVQSELNKIKTFYSENEPAKLEW